MRIHVVSEGESIWLIAREYGVKAEEMSRINNLSDLPCIVPGQALLIPSSEIPYAVKDEETIKSISEKFDVSIDRIMISNNINGENSIKPGDRIKIPEDLRDPINIEVGGYTLPSIPDRERQIIQGLKSRLTYIMPFSYQVSSDGELHPIEDNIILYEAKDKGIAPILVVANQVGTVFDKDLAHYILGNKTVQQNLIKNILKTLKSKGYMGLNIDFEKMPPEDRGAYNSFLKQVVNVLHSENYPVSVSLVPKASDIEIGNWHGTHDYRAIGEIADYVVIMTYEWGWSGGPPLAVSPLDQVRKVVEYAASQIDPHKVMMGIALYGYDWVLPYIPGGRPARRVSPQQALYIAAKHDAFIYYDERYQCPYFNYIGDDGKRHAVWFEDARSIEAKFNAVRQYNLKGVIYWLLGSYFPQNWYVIDRMCRVKKL